MSEVAIILGIGSLLLLALLYCISRIVDRRTNQSRQISDQANMPDNVPITPVFNYDDADFVNKNCTDLKGFIINDDINKYDIYKLAELNNIELGIPEGWIPLVIELIKELDAEGWNRHVNYVKEKYASLRFSTSAHYEIREKYEQISETVCQECGGRGEIRYLGWDFTLCRKHYLERRGKVKLTSGGFTYRAKTINWSDVCRIDAETLYNETKVLIKIELTSEAAANLNITMGNSISINNSVIGFGHFINNLPRNLVSLGFPILEKFTSAVFCEICGYKAVYAGKCECCENDTWETYEKKWSGTYNNEYDYLKYRQIFWIEDEGEKYVQIQQNYIKNPEHKILYSKDEIDQQDRQA